MDSSAKSIGGEEESVSGVHEDADVATHPTREAVRQGVDRDDVDSTVTGHVAEGDRDEGVVSAIAHRGDESAVAPVHQHREIHTRIRHDDDLASSVPVQVCHRHGRQKFFGWIFDCIGESTVAPVQQHTQSPADARDLPSRSSPRPGLVCHRRSSPQQRPRWASTPRDRSSWSGTFRLRDSSRTASPPPPEAFTL